MKNLKITNEGFENQQMSNWKLQNNNNKEDEKWTNESFKWRIWKIKNKEAETQWMETLKGKQITKLNSEDAGKPQMKMLKKNW